MQIFVKNLSGETIVLQISEGSSVLDLKNQLAQETGIEACYQILVCGGSVLIDDEQAQKKISELETVYMNLALEGGKKKKKKKQYTTKKKTKHIHKKTKLHTLKLYNVDSTGVKIQFAKKVCPECGAGYFMAKHYDRHYCGKCHSTLKLDQATIKANLAEIEKNKSKAAAGQATDAGKKDAGKGGADKKKKK